MEANQFARVMFGQLISKYSFFELEKQTLTQFFSRHCSECCSMVSYLLRRALKNKTQI
jgi:hypothetical protein